MNHPLTPSQIEFHKAAKEREARKLEAARRHRMPVVAIEPPLVIRDTKRRKRKSRAKSRIIPKGFHTSFRRKVIQEGEYCPHSGGSRELIVDRSMLEIAISVLTQFPGVTVKDIKGQSRARAITFPRHVVAHAIRKERRDFSFPKIGRFLGDRDHSCILNSSRVINDMLEDGRFKFAYDRWKQDMRFYMEGRK